MIGVALFIVAVLIISIWVVIEIKRMKHKLFAVFLIALILFSYISFTVIFKGKDVDYRSVDGLIDAGKIYFLWLASVFGNIKIITTNAINMDWASTNSSIT